MFKRLLIMVLSAFIPNRKKRKSFRKKFFYPSSAEKKETIPVPAAPEPVLKQYKQNNFKVALPSSKKEVLFLYTSNTSNSGDLNSCPKQYFHFNCFPREADIVTKFNSTADIAEKNIIIGGGIHPWLYFDNEFTRRMNPEISIGWGLGMCTGDIFPKTFLEKMSLIGLREFNYPFIDNKKIFYVPCPSCMNTQFDRKYETKHEMVFYAHYMQKEDQKILSHLPVMTNYEPDLSKVLRFISSGEIICTNSYHGAYWALLLGKKVIYKGYARKWGAFKYPPVYVESFSDIRGGVINRALNYPEALAECRAVNMDFYQRVADKFNL